MFHGNFTFPPITDFHVEYAVNEDVKIEKAKIFPPHIHDTLEFYVHLEGDASFVVEDKIYKISPGDVVISRPNELHNCILHTESIHKSASFWLDTSAFFLLSNFLDETSERLLSPKKEEKEKISALCTKLMDAGTKGEKNRIFYLLLELLDTFKQNISASANAELKTVPLVLKKILADLNENFVKIDKLEYFLKKYFISQSTLNRLFKTHLHTSPKLYLETKKLAYSRILLKEGKRVVDACKEAGFSDYSNFIRLFKKRFSVTPKEYQSR